MIIVRKEMEIEAIYNGFHYLGSIYQGESDSTPRVYIRNLDNPNEMHDFPITSLKDSAKETENYLRMANNEGI